MKAPKPTKPYPDFPLFLHQTGQWAKKVRGRMHYFGADADAALAKWKEQQDDLRAGRTPRLHPDGVTVRNVVNRFLTSKKALVETGELSPRTWGDYYTTCERLIDVLGKSRSVADLAGEDFEKLRTALAKTRGPVALGNEIQRVRTVLKFAWVESLIVAPVRFGSTFKKPSRKTMRRARHAAGSKVIEAGDLRKLIDAAGVPLMAMVLLGINAGFGQSDVAGLPMAALDLERGWINFPRPKTHIGRRCPLWPETVEALRAAIEGRPDHKDDADSGLVFITKYGKRWVRVKAKQDDDGNEKAGVTSDAVSLEFGKLLALLDLKRKGLGFYALRHTFRTVADRSKDQPAVDHLMGHVREDMASLYRERVDDDRLEAVLKVVRTWLWPGE
jgi:integrase